MSDSKNEEGESPNSINGASQKESDFSSSQAVEAALTLATLQSRAQMEGRSIGAVGQGDDTEKTKMETDLDKLLQTERARARWLIRERAVGYATAKNTAESLRLIPFSPQRLVDAPINLRESFTILMSQIVLLHLSQQPAMSEAARAAVASTCESFLEHCLLLLSLTKSPALGTIYEGLECYRFQIPMKFVRESAFEELPLSDNSQVQETKKVLGFESLLNLNPTKKTFIMLSEQLLKSQIDQEFNKNRKLVDTEKGGVLKLLEELNLNIESHDSFSQRPVRGFLNESQELKRTTPKGSKDDFQIDDLKSTNVNPLAWIDPQTSSSAILDREKRHRTSDGDLSSLLGLPAETLEFKLIPPHSAGVLVRDILMMFLLSNRYNATIHVLFKRLAESLGILPVSLLMAVEANLLGEVAELTAQEEKEDPRTRNARRLKVAGFAVGLGALSALTAGFAAPAIAAGFGALGIVGTSGATAFLGTVGGSATMASVFGASTAGLTGWKYGRRIGKIKVFEFDRMLPEPEGSGVLIRALTMLAQSNTEELTMPISQDGVSAGPPPLVDLSQGESRSLDNFPSKQPTSSSLVEGKSSKKKTSRTPSSSSRTSFGSDLPRGVTQQVDDTFPSLTVSICISGWLRTAQDIWRPWKGLCVGLSEIFALRWDPTFLIDLGNLLTNMLSQKFGVSAAQLWLQTTVAGALSTALMWPVTMMQYAASLDNAWAASSERAVQAGKLLAAAIADRKTLGLRPVSLLGFSMGARVIYSCLIELRRREAFHLVEDVVLMGTPTTCDKVKWQKAREVVSGRFVNVYSKADWLLGFMFRYMEWGVTVAGISPVKVDGIENIDISGIVRNHNQYADRILDILAFIEYRAAPEQRELDYISKPSTEQTTHKE